MTEADQERAEIVAHMKKQRDMARDYSLKEAVIVLSGVIRDIEALAHKDNPNEQ